MRTLGLETPRRLADLPIVPRLKRRAVNERFKSRRQIGPSK